MEETVTNSNLATRPTAALARPLKVLVPLIKDELQNAYAAGIDHYRKVGEMLHEARSHVKRDNKESWGNWLAVNFRLSETTARGYMGLATELQFRDAEEEIQQNQHDGDTRRAVGMQRPEIRTLSDYTHPNREKGHGPAWHEPVKQITNALDVGRIKREYEDRMKEKKVIRALALQLIDIGYKVLATKLHPDKGGSDEAMRRLNEIKTSLKKFTEDQWSR